MLAVGVTGTVLSFRGNDDQPVPVGPVISNCNSGSKCFKTDLDGTYEANSAQELYSAVVGLTSIDPADVLDEARAAVAAAEAPLAALMLQINATSAAAVAGNVRAVHDQSGLPVVLQDYPVATGIRVPAETIADVLDRTDCISAVKCESPPTALANCAAKPFSGGRIAFRPA